MADTRADRSFKQGDYDSALSILEEGLKEEGDGNDQLLYLLDLGLVAHTAGQIEKSTKYFLESDKIADLKDYTSLASEATSLLVGDNIKHYKGENFEKVLINAYLAMNFAEQGNLESALVEARKVNRKLELMITEGKRKYQLNAFAYYLSGILYEASGEYDDAYIDYKKTHELVPFLPGIGEALWRAAALSRREDDADRWQRNFNLSADTLSRARLLGRGKSKGEIIAIFENGISPIKRAHPQWHSVPKFFPRYNPVEYATVEVDGIDVGRTHVVHDIQSTAIQNLDDDYAGIIAKKIAGVVVKEVVGDQVAKQTKSEGLGFLTKLILHASDQADVRSWQLLPKDLQIARAVVDPGTHAVKLRMAGSRDHGREYLKHVKVAAGGKAFVFFRYMP